MSERMGAGVDLLEMVLGLFQVAGGVNTFQSEVCKIRPQIDKGMARNPGVLLVMRTEKSGIGGTISRVLGVHFGGAGQRPEYLVGQWRSGAHLFPAAQGTVEETYIWVVRNKDFRPSANRPPGYYPKDMPEIKFLPYEQL